MSFPRAGVESSPVLLLRPLGNPTDRDGREDDDERDHDGVEELGGQGSPRLAEELGK
jgi:hypothetical protein